MRFPLLPDTIRWLGVAVVAGVLVYFSLFTTSPVPPEPGPFWDKKLHFAGYATLGLSLLYATARWRLSHGRRAILSIGVAVTFGVLVEFLQGPLPDRYFSYTDMFANTLGALLAAGWLLLEPHLEYVKLPN